MHKESTVYLNNGTGVFWRRNLHWIVFLLLTVVGTFGIDAPFFSVDYYGSPPFGTYWLFAFLTVMALLWNRLAWPKIGVFCYALLMALLAVIVALDTVEPALAARYGTDPFYAEPLVSKYLGKLRFFFVLNGLALFLGLIVIWMMPTKNT